MFDTRKFGGYLSYLRKKADMTQSELADKLNLTRQAVSRYERGDSFPDVSVLVIIADIFSVSVESLINSGDPTRGEAAILENAAKGEEHITADKLDDIVNLAPLLKPSVLGKISSVFAKQDIDISRIVELSEYLNSDSTLALLENATFDTLNEELLERFAPFLDVRSYETIFDKILEGEMDWHLLKIILPYAHILQSQIEAAVIEGILPWEALEYLRIP